MLYRDCLFVCFLCLCLLLMEQISGISHYNVAQRRLARDYFAVCSCSFSTLEVSAVSQLIPISFINVCSSRFIFHCRQGIAAGNASKYLHCEHNCTNFKYSHFLFML